MSTAADRRALLRLPKRKALHQRIRPAATLASQARSVSRKSDTTAPRRRRVKKTTTATAKVRIANVDAGTSTDDGDNEENIQKKINELKRFAARVIDQAPVSTPKPADDDDVELEGLLVKEQARVDLERDADERRAIAWQRVEMDVKQFREQQTTVLESNLQCAQESFKRRQDAKLKSIADDLRKQLADRIKAARTVSDERMAERVADLQKTYAAKTEEEEARVRKEFDEELEKRAESVQAAWRTQHEARMAELDRELAEDRLRRIRKQRADHESALQNEIVDIRHAYAKETDDILSKTKNDLEVKKRTRVAELRERLEAERDESIAELERTLAEDMEKDLRKVEKECRHQTSTRLDELKAAYDREKSLTLTDVYSRAQQTAEAQIRNLRQQHEADLAETIASEQRRLEAEHLSRLEADKERHAAMIAQIMHDISVKFLAEHDDCGLAAHLKSSDVAMKDKIAKMAGCISDLRRRLKESTTCNTCRKLLAYNAELLSRGSSRQPRDRPHGDSSASEIEE
ncbi:Trichohyalin-plectin-homology domain-containing protein [Plasmodiophora brassicae]